MKTIIFNFYKKVLSLMESREISYYWRDEFHNGIVHSVTLDGTPLLIQQHVYHETYFKYHVFWKGKLVECPEDTVANLYKILFYEYKKRLNAKNSKENEEKTYGWIQEVLRINQ